MTALSDLKFYATPAHPCGYLEDEQATMLFADPEATIDATTYSQLIDLGFRRSGAQIYRPHCEQCKACVPARVPVDSFKPSRSQRRIFNRNQDLRVVELNDIFNQDCYQLFERYINVRHRDGDMYPPSYEQYITFLTKEMTVTRYYGFMLDEQLIAVAVTDQTDNGLSAIYTFFDPDMDKRSLGVYGILWQIEQCKALGLAFVYLGYWIKACSKMSYKTDYRPLQLYLNNRWLTLS